MAFFPFSKQHFFTWLSQGLITVVSLGLLWMTFEAYYLFVYHRDKPWQDVGTRFDPEIGWRTAYQKHKVNPWGAYTTNSLGFRSREIETGKDHVVMIGDSVVWGYRLDDSQAIPIQLEQFLGPQKIQVLNLGVSGYSIDQYYLYLKRHIDKIPRLKAVILVLCSAGEFDETISNMAYSKRKSYMKVIGGELVNVSAPINRIDFVHTHAWTYLMTYLGGRSRAAEELLLHLANYQTHGDAEGREVVKRLLIEIKNLVESRGGRLHILMSPSDYDFTEKSEDLLNLESLLNELQIPFWDYLTYLKSKNLDPAKLYLDGEHYTPFGTRLMAEYIARRIKDTL